MGWMLRFCRNSPPELFLHLGVVLDTVPANGLGCKALQAGEAELAPQAAESAEVGCGGGGGGGGGCLGQSLGGAPGRASCRGPSASAASVAAAGGGDRSERGRGGRALKSRDPGRLCPSGHNCARTGRAAELMKVSRQWQKGRANGPLRRPSRP